MSLFFYPLLHSSPHHPPGVQRCVVAAVQECGVVHRGRRGGPEGAYHWWVLFPGCFGVVLCVCVGVPQLLPISNFHPPQPHYLLTTATLSSYHSHTIFLPQPHYLLTTATLSSYHTPLLLHPHYFLSPHFPPNHITPFFHHTTLPTHHTPLPPHFLPSTRRCLQHHTTPLPAVVGVAGRPGGMLEAPLQPPLLHPPPPHFHGGLVVSLS